MTRQWLRELSEQGKLAAKSLAFAPNGQALAIGYDDGLIELSNAGCRRTNKSRAAKKDTLATDSARVNRGAVPNGNSGQRRAVRCGTTTNAPPGLATTPPVVGLGQRTLRPDAAQHRTIFHEAVLRACREAGFVPHAPYEVDHLQMVLRMVAAGAGVALVPASAGKVNQDRVIYRALRPLARSLCKRPLRGVESASADAGRIHQRGATIAASPARVDRVSERPFPSGESRD